MRKKTLALTLLFLLSLTPMARGADYLLAIGGGGEAPKPDTIFDGALKNLGEYVKNTPGIHADVAFDGGHPVTDGIIQNNFPASVGKSRFLDSDYQRLIQSYKTKLENNEMVPGDQFMIYIDSHGASKQEHFKTHSISTAGGAVTNVNTLSGAKLVDLDQLEVLKKLAKEKGVRMAIFDGSCHSGNTLSLADDNTCVITSTGPNHFGYSFAQIFTKAMKKGKNLEEIFLEARAEDDSPGLPMISTPAGLEVNNLIYEKITPYLYHVEMKDDKLMPYLRENSNEMQMCVANQNYNSLLETIRSIESQYAVTKKVLWRNVTTNDVDLSKLKTLLETYKRQIDTAALKMRALDIDRLKKNEVIKVSAKYENYSTEYESTFTWEDMLNSDYDKRIEEMNERIAKEQDPFEKVSLMSTLSQYTQTKAKKEEILKTNPDLTSLAAKQEELKKTIEMGYFTARDVALEERKLYQALYTKSQSKNSQNACQNFKI